MSLNSSKELPLAESEYQTVIYYGDGRTLGNLWDAWQGHQAQPFSVKTEIFFWILERLLREGRIRLHKDGVFLEESIEHQIRRFRKAWPSSEHPYPDHPNAGFDLWFFDPDCPVGIAWQRDDGSYQVTD